MPAIGGFKSHWGTARNFAKDNKKSTAIIAGGAAAGGGLLVGGGIWAYGKMKNKDEK